MLRVNLKIPSGWRMGWGWGHSGRYTEAPREAAGGSRSETAVALDPMVAAGPGGTRSIGNTRQSGTRPLRQRRGRMWAGGAAAKGRREMPFAEMGMGGARRR